MTPFKVIGTDSWDTTQLGDDLAANFLIDNSYVILPDSSAGERIFGGRNLKRYFEDMTPDGMPE